MKTYKITILPGDGIGPEIMTEAVKVMKTVASEHDINLSIEHGVIGATAIKETGKALPVPTLEMCKKSDAVLMGAVGDPIYDNDPGAPVRPEQGLLAIRKGLGLFANIRPVKTYSYLYDNSPLKNNIVKDVDFIVFRELTGGIYFGDKGRKNNGNLAYDTNIYSRSEIERIAKLAFEEALKRKKKLCLVDKANVLETSRLWRETVGVLAKQHRYSDVEYTSMFVDNAAMQIITNPAQFDVILTENMFGDIITDEASVITGSMGLMPSASVGENNALFEPVHGSYPQAAGKNIANPMAMILSVAMMFDFLGEKKASDDIVNAVEAALKTGFVTEDISASDKRKTQEVGDWICKVLVK